MRRGRGSPIVPLLPCVLLLALGQACAGSAGPHAGGGVDRFADDAATGWLLAMDDGSVVMSTAQEERVVLAAWGTREPADYPNPGVELKAPVIAHDPVAGLLWYSDSHESIRSISLVDGRPGPYFAGFADTAIQGCGVTSNGRLFAIDSRRRTLYAPMLTGQVLSYEIETGDVRGSIPMSSFDDLVLGRYRTIAVEPGGKLWALDDRGIAREYDPERAVATARIVTARASDLTIDPARGLLLLREDDSYRAVALDTLAEVSADIPVAEGVAHAVPLTPQLERPEHIWLLSRRLAAVFSQPAN